MVFSCHLCNLVVLYSSSFLAGDLQFCPSKKQHLISIMAFFVCNSKARRSGMKSGRQSQLFWNFWNLANCNSVHNYGWPRFGFTEGSFLLLNSQRHLRSVAEDLISNKQKRTKQIYQKRRRHGYHKTLKSIFLNRSYHCLISTRHMKINITWWRRRNELWMSRVGPNTFYCLTW